MDEVIGACPSKKTKPLFPDTLSRFWKEVVDENDPNTQENPPTAVMKPEAIRFTALAVPVKDGAASGAFASRAVCRPEVLAMLRDASGQVKAPQVRGVLKVLPPAFMVKRVVDDEFRTLNVPSVDLKE